ncbi:MULTISPECIES: carboxymuconolactone decarboxylase family protein [Acidobacteriaceae]|uniref:carboxymuconolactone decarboxylase family protein n=1 Tax=Acidobacteriaceae TaxID=204434 RepID=UPI00131AFFF9|nr:MULTISPECIES: peroxidase-related enzyme [Acidobacteriaceae]MDW5266762.1 peroxidase-related enzyme [Edaphobacter sp.]
MPHISLPEGIPGISSGFAFRPETAKPMRELAHVLLHEPSTLSPAERELIATYVSSQNDCYFCQTSHGAAAAAHLRENASAVDQVKHDFMHAAVSDKLKALLVIAGQVQQSGKNVSPDSVQKARELGATDLEIHDTVLIAAAFCMYNRYVDGLATWQPRDPAMYAAMGEHLAAHGYIAPSIKP